MTIASQHAKATRVSECSGWLIDHSMLSCRHLCVVCRSSRPFIEIFSFSDHHHHYLMDGIRKSRKWKSMFLLEYQWVQCVCVYWWERWTHLIRVSIEMNERNLSFLTCMFIRKDKHLVWFFSFLLFLSSILKSYQKMKKKRMDESQSHAVIESSVRWIRRQEIYIYTYINAYVFFLLLSTSNHPSNLFFAAYVCAYILRSSILA